jgi:hypothetical protein
VASASDNGMYECETAQGDIYKFELVVEEIDIEPVCDEAVAKNFNVLIGEDIEFTCGEESTEHDDQIEWEKIGGVKKYKVFGIEKLLTFIFIHFFFAHHRVFQHHNKEKQINF